MSLSPLLTLTVVDDSAFWLPAVAILGLFGGVFLFFQGFQMLRYKRLILNTPLSKIRSASIGLVEVSGTPAGPKTIASAITGSPCFYYRARGWQWITSDKGGGSWKQVVDESVCVPFFLDDGTGKVLVNPQGATLDVHRSFYDDFGIMSLVGKNSIVPESIRKFVATRGLMSGEQVRLEEHIIKPGYPLFAFGTLGENTLNSWDSQPQTGGKQISLGFCLGDFSGFKFNVSTNVSGVAASALAGMLKPVSSGGTQTFTYIARSEDGPAPMPDELVQKLRSGEITLPAAAQGAMTKAMLTGGSRSIVTQLGGPSAGTDAGTSSASATAVQDQQTEASAPKPSDFDLHTRVALSKGERGDPFTISSRSQREVVESLGWKAIGYIWGGPVLALICLYCLMALWGWM